MDWREGKSVSNWYMEQNVKMFTASTLPRKLSKSVERTGNSHLRYGELFIEGKREGKI